MGLFRVIEDYSNRIIWKNVLILLGLLTGLLIGVGFIVISFVTFSGCNIKLNLTMFVLGVAIIILAALCLIRCLYWYKGMRGTNYKKGKN